MGVKILNKDVSVISSILSKPKANIGSVGGIIGWAGGGGGGSTPTPTPNWANISFDGGALVRTVAVQQIQGITSTITLEVSRSSTPLGSYNAYYRINSSAPVWTNGGSVGTFTGWTLIASFPVTFNVTNNQYVSFGCQGGTVDQTTTITVKNNSDSATILDTFTLTIITGF